MTSNRKQKEREVWLRMKRRGQFKYVLSVLLFQAWPAGLFFGTFTFFPFTVKTLLGNVDSPVQYMAFWTVMGIVVGLVRWRSRRRQFEDLSVDASEVVPS